MARLVADGSSLKLDGIVKGDGGDVKQAPKHVSWDLLGGTAQ